MDKLSLNYAEFYITNVCNLDCPNCNRFNNRKFKGHYFFDEDMYAPWAERINLTKCSILGGEPSLHPELSSWITGLHRLWPDTTGSVVSNGTNLKKVSNLVNALAESKWHLSVCVHNVDMRNYVLDQINTTFGHCRFNRLLTYQDSIVNGMEFITPDDIVIEITNGANFHNNIFKDSQYQLHDSDIVKAHDVCTMTKCHHFIDGKLYKCGVVYLLPEYFRQAKIPYPELYDQYQPLTFNNLTQQQLNDLSELPIPQCKFCPDKLHWSSNQSKFKSKILNIKVLNYQE